MIWVPELEFTACATNHTRSSCETDVLARLKELVDATARMMVSLSLSLSLSLCLSLFPPSPSLPPLPLSECLHGRV